MRRRLQWLSEIVAGTASAMKSRVAPSDSHRHPLLSARLVALLAILTVLAALMALYHERLPGPREIQNSMEQLGWLGLALFVPVAAGLRLGLFPSSVLSMAAGLLFGPWVGALASAAASTITACIQLIVGRYVAGEGRRRLPARLRGLDSFIERHGWLAIIYVRLIPVPHGLINYATGYTSLRLWHMALGTILGAMPLAIAYATVGGNLDDPLGREVQLALAGLAILLLLGPLLARRVTRSGRLHHK